MNITLKCAGCGDELNIGEPNDDIDVELYICPFCNNKYAIIVNDPILQKNKDSPQPSTAELVSDYILAGIFFIYGMAAVVSGIFDGREFSWFITTPQGRMSIFPFLIIFLILRHDKFVRIISAIYLIVLFTIYIYL